MILVLGKTGQVGSELSKIEGVECFERDQLNLANPDDCFAAITQYKPHAVINAAAYTSVDKAEEEEDLAHLINAEAPKAIAKACSYLEIPLVHISTDYVFDGTGISAWQTFDCPKPLNSYGRSKFGGEIYVREYAKNYVILRTSWIVSSYRTNFLKTMLRISETQSRLGVVNDQIGGPTPAHSIASACVKIANKLAVSPNMSGIYHLSGSPDVSWCQFANEIFKQVGRKTVAEPIPTSEFPTSAKRPLNSRLDCQMIKEVFNINRPHWRQELSKIFQDLEVMT